MTPDNKRIKELTAACVEALDWIESKTSGYVVDVKDTLRLALHGTINPKPDKKILSRKKS